MRDFNLHFETVFETYPIQDFDGEPRDANAGRDYFKKRFARLAQKAGRSKEREIYIQFVTCNLLILTTSAQAGSVSPLQQIPLYYG